MIYTCYEMVRDCRADRPKGWEYFLSSYIPVIRRLLAHYAPEKSDLLGRILVTVRRPDSSLFQSMEPAPERPFVAELRQKVLAELEAPVPEARLLLEEVAAAFEPFTLVEKQAAWIETMGYGPPETGAMLRMAPATVEKIRNRAAELLRGKVDAWSRSMLRENGLLLGRAAAAAGTNECLPAKAFLDVLDGRATWRGREEMEQHATACWHCIDHFCRLAEVLEVLRGIQPLTESEAEPFRKVLGIAAGKRPLWKRWMGARPFQRR
jgi:hypothetical protein